MLGIAIGDGLGITSEGMLPGSRRERYGELWEYLPNEYTGERKDTSALLSLLLQQEATDQLKKALLASDESLVVWWGTKVEAVSAVSRLQRDGHIESGADARLLKHLDGLLSAAYEVQPLEEVRTTACRALRVHELRAADALQLAAALVWAEHHPTGLGFVCLDGRLREAATREGFEVLPDSP